MPAKRALLIIDPLAEEKRAAHRMFVRLARDLAQNHATATLKFDLSGTGDSAGRHQDATWEQWLEDGAAAMEVLKSESRCQDIALLGARGGALLATRLAILAKANRLILVEPVLSGNDFLRDLERRQAIKETTEGLQEDTPDAATRWARHEAVDFGGFLFNDALAEGIRQTAIPDLLPKLPDGCTLRGIRVSASKKLPPAWQPIADVTTIVQDKPFWGQLDYYESDFVNQAIIQSLL